MNYIIYELKHSELAIMKVFRYLFVLVIGILNTLLVRMESPVSRFNSGNSECNLWFESSIISLNSLSHAAWRLSSSVPRLFREIASLYMTYTDIWFSWRDVVFVRCLCIDTLEFRNAKQAKRTQLTIEHKYSKNISSQPQVHLHVWAVARNTIF